MENSSAKGRNSRRSITKPGVFPSRGLLVFPVRSPCHLPSFTIHTKRLGIGKQPVGKKDLYANPMTSIGNDFSPGSNLLDHNYTPPREIGVGNSGDEELISSIAYTTQ